MLSRTASLSMLRRDLDRISGPRPRRPNGVGAWILIVASASACASPAARLHPDLAKSIALYTGVAGRVDDEEARRLLLSARSDGDLLGRMWVARAHSRGRMGFPRDSALAVALAADVVDSVRVLADRGHPEAMFLMGTVYDEALGVEGDPVEAAEWYRAASERGHVLAQHNLGNAYRAGRGVAQGHALAARWWRAAAEAGDAIAQLRLGEAYEAGRGVTADRAAALRWYQAAASRGNAAAREGVARLGG